MRTGRPVCTHLPHLPLPPFVYDVAQDTVAPGHNMYFLSQSLWPRNSADCHTGHESPESLKLLTDPQIAGRLLRKAPLMGHRQAKLQSLGDRVQQSILRQNSRSTNIHSGAGVSDSLCPLPRRVARWLPRPIWAAGSHEEKLLPSWTLWDFLSHLASVLAM